MCYFRGAFRRFLDNSGNFCGRGATLWCGNSLLSPNEFTLGDLMKIKWFVNNVSAARSPDRAEHAILGDFGCAFFRKFRPHLRSGAS